MDVNRLSRGDKIVAGAAVLLFVDMFLNWYSANVSDQIAKAASSIGVDTSVDAWKIFSTTDILMFVAIIAALAMVGMRASGREVPESAPMVVAALASFTTLVVLYRIINQPGDNSFINVEYGAYLGLILSATLTYGAFQVVGEGGGVSIPAPMTPAPAAAAAAAPAATTVDPAPPSPAPTPTPPAPAPDPVPPPSGPDPEPVPAPEPQPPAGEPAPPPPSEPGGPTT